MLKLSQFYSILRFVLLRRRSRWERLLLVMQLMDRLEHDYHDVYPDEPMVMDEGFEEALRRLVVP